jgi:hypothetical protein
MYEMSSNRQYYFLKGVEWESYRSMVVEGIIKNCLGLKARKKETNTTRERESCQLLARENPIKISPKS